MRVSQAAVNLRCKQIEMMSTYSVLDGAGSVSLSAIIQPNRALWITAKLIIIGCLYKENNDKTFSCQHAPRPFVLFCTRMSWSSVHWVPFIYEHVKIVRDVRVDGFQGHCSCRYQRWPQFFVVSFVLNRDCRRCWFNSVINYSAVLLYL